MSYRYRRQIVYLNQIKWCLMLKMFRVNLGSAGILYVINFLARVKEYFNTKSTRRYIIVLKPVLFMKQILVFPFDIHRKMLLDLVKVTKVLGWRLDYESESLGFDYLIAFDECCLQVNQFTFLIPLDASFFC